MKLHYVALAAAAAFVGQAHALTPAQMNAATTLKSYFSGASATKAAFGQLFAQNCQAATRTDYTLATSSTFGTIYTCTLNTTNDFGLGAINVMFQKRDAGGSGQGVYPVANGVSISFIDPTTCSGTTCTGTVNRIPDGGTSDVEPKLFEATLNTPSGFSGAVNVDNITVEPYVSAIMGLGVSNALYTKLQADQGLAANVRPQVSRAAVAMMLRNNFYYDSIAWKLLLPNTNDGTQNSQVTICRRVNGSGSQASANRFFLDYPFNSGSSAAPFIASNSSVAVHGTTAGNLYVVENSAAADVGNCLTNANAAGGFAIGHISLENAEPAGWKFVKIDNQTPSREEAKVGRYAYFFESTCQYRNALIDGVNAYEKVKTFAQKLCQGSSAPDNLAALSATVQNGVMTPPQNAACQPAVTANAITFCSSVTRNGNSAEYPSPF